MSQVIIYGGAFNPPTVAHHAILRACVVYAETVGAEVWLMPSGSRRDKSIATDIEARLLLVDSLIKDVADAERVEVCEYEIDTGGLVETRKTHAYLQKAHPDTQFIWVFGSDSIKMLKSWGGGEQLWNELHMLVVPRVGYELAEMPPHTVNLIVDVPVVSSTQVRDAQRTGTDFRHMVTPSVYQHMRKIAPIAS